ncbi:hypothetical protein AM1_4809 [Acaryochloris marina MBIC11017]|uniref:Uncharacterized protein n=1 Tax=Acaryochloris marina (strain MBIC 11017) TaxID=329726 RepID=B0C2J0_ACAM1|nr:hypothetical protein AM1_4809 [Acaryochloris marina MBIC11017]
MSEVELIPTAHHYIEALLHKATIGYTLCPTIRLIQYERPCFLIGEVVDPSAMQSGQVGKEHYA